MGNSSSATGVVPTPNGYSDSHNRKVFVHPEGDYGEGGEAGMKTIFKEMREMKRQIGQLENKSFAMQTQLSAVLEENKQLKLDLEALKTKNIEQEQMIKQLEKIAEKHDAVLEENQALKKTVEDYLAENKDLKNRVSRLTRGKPETRNWWKIAFLALVFGLVGFAAGGFAGALIFGGGVCCAVGAGGGLALGSGLGGGIPYLYS